MGEQYSKARQSMLISQIIAKKESKKRDHHLVLERYFAGEMPK